MPTQILNFLILSLNKFTLFIQWDIYLKIQEIWEIYLKFPECCYVQGAITN